MLGRRGCQMSSAETLRSRMYSRTCFSGATNDPQATVRPPKALRSGVALCFGGRSWNTAAKIEVGGRVVGARGWSSQMGEMFSNRPFR